MLLPGEYVVDSRELAIYLSEHPGCRKVQVIGSRIEPEAHQARVYLFRVGSVTVGIRPPEKHVLIAQGQVENYTPSLVLVH